MSQEDNSIFPGTWDYSSPAIARAVKTFTYASRRRPPDCFANMQEITEATPTLRPVEQHRVASSNRIGPFDSREQIMEEARIFRNKKLPCDALIYLGTGFCPSGWNTGHGSFAFNRGSLSRSAEAMIREFHDLHFNVVLHVLNPPENLHGQVTDTGPAASAPSDAANYWQQHVPLIEIGVDGWWPDEGDALPVASRLVRNRMYWEGWSQDHPEPEDRFALHRNCYAGIQRWGWLWSGDTSSTWKTLETQIAMGITAGLSGVPYWGTGHRRFCAHQRVYGRAVCAMVPVWRILSIVSLPRTDLATAPALGMEYGELRPIGDGAECRGILPKGEELHDAAVEPICRRFLNTRSQLMPYLYSAVWETHTTGIPLIRSLGIQFPEDPAAATVDGYLFGPSLLVAPVFEQGAAERKVYLPAGGWYDFWTAKRIEGEARL